MADEDFSKLNGQVAQAFVPGGSNAAALTHDLSNITFWAPTADCVYEYDTGNFDAPVELLQGTVRGVPSDAKTLTFTVATKIEYSRKNQANG